MKQTLQVLAAFLAAFFPACTDAADSESALLTELDPPATPGFEHTFTRDTSYYMPESIAAGVALLDSDGDGDLDVYVVDGAGRSGRLFRRDGDEFTDVTDRAGFAPLDYGVGVAVGDFDNDGRPDLYLTNVGPDALYRNMGGYFEEVTASAGIDNPAWGTSATWLDFDRDGWLDLYVTNYVAITEGVTCPDRAGAPEYCGPTAYPGVRDRLFRNQGDGRFRDVSAESGIGAKPGRGLGVASIDFDRDGWRDIYVANDGEPNFLWRNRGNGTFQERALQAGVAMNGAGQAEAGMGIAVGDVDGDRWPDIFVTHLAGESNTLYLNRGDGSFVDETAARGLHGPSLPYTGFGTGMADLDNDGDLDIVVANGRINRGPVVPGAPAGFLQRYAEPNAVFVNDGTGRFTEPARSPTALSNRPGMSRGLAVGDLDDDGRTDLLILETGRELRRLESGGRGEWIGFSLTDPDVGNRHMPGAELELYAGGGPRRLVVNPNVGYLSSNDPRIHAGLGEVRGIDSVVVTWPDGGAEAFFDLPAGRYHALRRGDGAPRS